MPDRHFPVRPDLDQFKHQAKDLLKAIRGGEPDALATLAAHLPDRAPADARLHDAQFALARSYGLPSWPRLVLACRMTDAIWRDDVEAVDALVSAHPALLRENARGVESNWGPPLSYAANLGRDRIIERLHARGADDVQRAFARACLQGQVGTARRLHAMGARADAASVMGSCETLNATGLALAIELGAVLADADGDRLAPLALVLETYSRHPAGKHACLDVLEQSGLDLPDTPAMAVHRGRIDRLEHHLQRDPGLLERPLAHRDIYPPSLGCHRDETLALHGTPLSGGTLLHLAVDYDETAIIGWLLDRGADVNAGAARDADGVGGHTALFGCVVSQPYRSHLRTDDGVARMLLEAGADIGVRASLRKALRFVADESWHEYRDVTALEWGRRFHDQDWVNPAVMRLLSGL